MAQLSEEMKLAMQLSMEDDGGTESEHKEQPQPPQPPESTKPAMPKQSSFDFLSVIYILEVRHRELSTYSQHLDNVQEFGRFLKNVNAFCIIEDETPILSSTIEAIFIDRFQREFKVNKSSFKYLLKAYDRCLGFEERVHSYWTAVIPQKDQLEIIQNIETCILTFCGVLLSTPDLTTMDDFIKSQQEFQHILSSPVKGRDFPKGFLQSLACTLSLSGCTCKHCRCKQQRVI